MCVSTKTFISSLLKTRAATLGTRRTVKKQWQAAWLCRAVTCIDLTTLSGDDTAANVSRLCLKAGIPIRKDIVQVGPLTQFFSVSFSQKKIIDLPGGQINDPSSGELLLSSVPSSNSLVSVSDP